MHRVALTALKHNVINMSVNTVININSMESYQAILNKICDVTGADRSSLPIEIGKKVIVCHHTKKVLFVKHTSKTMVILPSDKATMLMEHPCFRDITTVMEGKGTYMRIRFPTDANPDLVRSYLVERITYIEGHIGTARYGNIEIPLIDRINNISRGRATIKWEDDSVSKLCASMLKFELDGFELFEGRLDSSLMVSLTDSEEIRSEKPKKLKMKKQPEPLTVSNRPTPNLPVIRSIKALPIGKVKKTIKTSNEQDKTERPKTSNEHDKTERPKTSNEHDKTERPKREARPKKQLTAEELLEKLQQAPLNRRLNNHLFFDGRKFIANNPDHELIEQITTEFNLRIKKKNVVEIPVPEVSITNVPKIQGGLKLRGITFGSKKIEEKLIEMNSDSVSDEETPDEEIVDNE